MAPIIFDWIICNMFELVGCWSIVPGWGPPTVSTSGKCSSFTMSINSPLDLPKFFLILRSCSVIISQCMIIKAFRLSLQIFPQPATTYITNLLSNSERDRPPAIFYDTITQPLNFQVFFNKYFQNIIIITFPYKWRNQPCTWGPFILWVLAGRLASSTSNSLKCLIICKPGHPCVQVIFFEPSSTLKLNYVVDTQWYNA